jgi:hypothetical protein
MQLISNSGSASMGCKEISVDNIGSTLTIRILRLLAEHSEGLHASAIARKLREHEQKIFYHTRKLIKNGLVEIHHTEDSGGGTAKILVLSQGAFAIRLRDFSPMVRAASPQDSPFLRPFIENGLLRACIVVGSPDPHGPEQARSRDANYAIDLALFLGTFLVSRPDPAVVLDTELRDWNQNLIIIGGPVVNKAAERINFKSPARYDSKTFFVGTKKYTQENTGVIVRMPNPFSKGKWMLYIAGKRHTGTRAAIIAFTTQFDKISRAAVTVVDGVDEDSDGVIDSARIVAQKS